ncbi:hypothetical protein L150_00474 [Candida albicans Ca529L]|nr:hypothetical protein L150_00474 [Candida albicans Ca529L]
MFRSIYRVILKRASPIINTRQLTVSSIRFNETTTTTSTTTTTTPKSSCPAGTVLNLKVFKKGDEPVAKEDSEYPEWLWTMLDPKDNLKAIQNEDFLRWRRIKLSKENNSTIKNNNFLSKL